MSLFQKLKATVAASSFADNTGKQAAAQRQARIEAERQASRPINSTAQVDYEAVLSSLDKRYLDAKYDPVGELVAALPLSQVALETFLEDTKPKQQLMLDSIQHRLSREVMANYTSFVDGMRQLSEIDMDVSRAAIHVSNSIRKLSNAKESLVSGTLGITYRRRRRERLAEVKQRSEWLRSLVTVEERVEKACKEHRYSDAVHIVIEGNTKLADPSARSYAVVNSLKVRVDGALDTLMDRMDRSLETQLISFDPIVYGALLQAYRDLDDHGVKARSHHRHGKETNAAATTTTASRTDRAGTIDDGSNFFDSFPSGNSHELDESSISINTGGLTNSNDGILNPGQSLLQEVGSSIAVAASLNNTTGIMSTKHIGSVDSNIASLPQTLQRSATSAAKSLTKDIIIDVLLKDIRARIHEAEQAAIARKRAGYDNDNESVSKHDEHDDLLGNIENMKAEFEDDANGNSSAKSKLPPEQEYTRRRNELRGLPYNHLCATLKAEDIPLAAMAVSAGITHVMHQHFLILQWHRAPYDFRNNYEGQEFLHRCGADEPEPIMEENNESSSGSTRPSSSTSTTASNATLTTRPRKPTDPIFIEVLRSIRPYLLRTRTNAWSSMQQRFSAMLFAAVGSESLNIPVERLAQILILSRDLMSVGLEYVGHGQKTEGSESISIELDPCNTLRGSLRLLCSQYMDAIHGECFSRLRDMLAKESWQSIPMTDASFVTLMESASTGFKSKFSKQATAAVQAATAAIMGSDMNNNDNGDGSNDDGEPLYRTYSDGASLFSSWLERGNPFGCVVLPPKASVTEDHTDSSTTAVVSVTAFVAGATVLHTPRPPIPNDADDDDDDDDDDNVPHDAAWQAKRAQAKLMRSIHGDGYHLDIGLGRGPSLGFNFSLSGEAGADKPIGGDSDDDLSDSSEEVIDDATSGSSDEDEDDDRRGRRIKRSEDADSGGLNGTTASTGTGGPFATAFGGKHGHTVTAAALNGFAKALGKYVLLMEVLPTVASDAFTGLARLFELYLYTVATLFLRPPAQRQLFDINTPTPQYVEKLVDSSVFEYVDGSAFHVAAKIGAAACEARDADHGKLMAASNNRNLRRTMSSYNNTSSSGLLDRSFSSDNGSSSGIPGSTRKSRNGRNSNENDDIVTMYGITLYTRGLPCIAQAQGFSSEYYTPLGAGAAIGNVLLGHIWNSDAVYLTLRRALQQIGADLSSGARSMGTGSTSVLADGHFSMDTGVSVRGLVPEPYVKLQASIEIEGEQATFGIVERCVAVESLDFLLDVMFRVRNRIESHLSASHATSITQFYTRAVQCSVQLRALIYHSMVPRLLPESGALPNMISSVKWETIKDAMEPSKYAVTDLPPFITRAANVLHDRMKNNGLPAISRFAIWSNIVSHIMERFVEGYSHVKKCTVPGRGLMSLDAGTLYSSCTRASTIIPSCLARDRSFVDSYIAAFYFDNETDLLDWINKNRYAYALHHIRGLINYGIGPGLKKKNLKDLLTTIDSMYVVPPPEDLQKQAKEVAQMGITGLSMMGAAMMGNTV